MSASTWCLIIASIIISVPSFVFGLNYMLPKPPNFNMRNTHPEGVNQKDVFDKVTELESRLEVLEAIKMSKSTHSQGPDVSYAQGTEDAQQVESLAKTTEDLESKVSSLEKEVMAMKDEDKLNNLSDENREKILAMDNGLVKMKENYKETKTLVEVLERDVSKVGKELEEIKEHMVDDTLCKDKGNLLLEKTSTDSRGNDGTDLCFLSTSTPVPYWQIDLQGFYTINNITIETCWGDWGHLAKSAVIEVFNVDPEKCEGAEKFVYGTIPSNAGPLQLYSFQASPPFAVSFLRISAPGKTSLSIRETYAFGVGPKKKKVAMMMGPDMKVANILSTAIVSSSTACGKLCDKADNCVAYSYNADVKKNCILSECTTGEESAGWTTSVANYYHC